MIWILLIAMVALIVVLNRPGDGRLYDHDRDEANERRWTKVAKFFHPDASELLDKELEGARIVSKGRKRGVDWASEFDSCAAEMQRRARGKGGARR